MKILKEGKAHKAKAIYCTCERCGSELRFFLDKGDPRVGRKKYNCDSRKSWCSYCCPICSKINKAEWESPYFKDEVNCRIEEIILEKDDLDEIDSYKDIEVPEDLEDRLESSFWKI